MTSHPKSPRTTGNEAAAATVVGNAALSDSAVVGDAVLSAATAVIGDACLSAAAVGVSSATTADDFAGAGDVEDAVLSTLNTAATPVVSNSCAVLPAAVAATVFAPATPFEKSFISICSA